MLAVCASCWPGASDGELVAAEPRDGVRPAQDLLEAPAQLGEQAVAALVTERVVDLLEAVEVDEQDGHAASELPGLGEGLLGAVPEERSVRQSGEIVMERLVLDLEHLAVEPPRHAAHDREERRVQRNQHELEDAGDREEGIAGRAGDRCVVLREREDPGGRRLALDRHRHVGVEDAGRALLALLHDGADFARALAGEGRADRVSLGDALADQVRRVRIRHAPVGPDQANAKRRADEHLALEEPVELRAPLFAHGRAEVARPELVTQDRLRNETGVKRDCALGLLGRVLADEEKDHRRSSREAHGSEQRKAQDETRRLGCDAHGTRYFFGLLPLFPESPPSSSGSDSSSGASSAASSSSSLPFPLP